MKAGLHAPAVTDNDILKELATYLGGRFIGALVVPVNIDFDPITGTFEIAPVSKNDQKAVQTFKFLSSDKAKDSSWPQDFISILDKFNKTDPFSIKCDIGRRIATFQPTFKPAFQPTALSVSSSGGAELSPSVSSSSGIRLNAPTMTDDNRLKALSNYLHDTLPSIGRDLAIWFHPLKNDFKIGASGGGDVAIIGLPKKGADASWEAGLVNILAGFNKIQPFTIVCNVAGKTAYLAVTDISISDRRAAAALISNRSAAVSPSVSSSSGIGLNAPAMKVHAPRTLSEMRAAANSSVSSSSNHNIGQYPPVQTNAASSPSVPQYYQPSIAPTSYNPVGVGSNEGWGMLDDSNFVYLADTYKPQAVQTSIQSTHEVTYPFRTPVLASSLSRSDINIIEKEIINPDINIQNAAHKKLFSAGVRKYLHNNAFDKMNVNGTYSEITFVHPDYQDALKPGFDENKVTCKMDSAGTKLIEICRHEKNNDLLIISAVGNNWPAMAYFSDSTEPTGYYVSHDPEFLKITVEKTKAAAQPAPQAVTVPSLNNLPQLTASSSSPNISTPLTGKINGKTKITFPFRTPFDDEQKAQEIRRDVLNNTIDDTAQFYKGVSISEHKKYILQRKYTIKNANNSFKQLVFAHQEYKDSSKEEFCREAVVFVMDDSGEKLLEIHRHKDKKLPVITITQPNDKQDLVLYSRGNENGKLVDFINDPNAVDVISYDTPGMKNIIGEPKDRDKEKHSAVVSSSGLPQDIAKKIINEKQNGVAPSYVDKFDKNNKGKGKGKEKESNISHKI